MIVMQAFRYALHHSGAAQAQYRRFAGARRWVWNEGLEYQLAARQRGEPVPRYVAVANLLPAWKVEHPWLKQVHSQV